MIFQIYVDMNEIKLLDVRVNVHRLKMEETALEELWEQYQDFEDFQGHAKLNF